MDGASMLYILQSPQQSLVDGQDAAGTRTNQDPIHSNARDVTYTDGDAELILLFALLE